jgi:toxin FitB
LYLLDTNVVSELRRARPHGAVVAWVGSIPDQHLHVSAVTLGELQAGVEITREQDPTRAAEIEAWIGSIAGLYNVLPLDGACFRAWAGLMHRKPDDLMMDALIAATAFVHNLTVVTRNARDFGRLGTPTLDPWRGRTSSVKPPGT